MKQKNETQSISGDYLKRVGKDILRRKGTFKSFLSTLWQQENFIIVYKARGDSECFWPDKARVF